MNAFSRAENEKLLQINRTCPRCGSLNITAYQIGNGYGRRSGEIIPVSCPACGTDLGNIYWGNLYDEAERIRNEHFRTQPQSIRA